MSKKIITKLFCGLLSICMLTAGMCAVSAETAETYKVEGEWYAGDAPTASYSHELLSGKRILNAYAAPGTEIDFDDYVYTYPICVKTAGVYKLSFVGLYARGVKLFVNDTEYTYASAGNAGIAAEDNWKYAQNYEGDIVLEAGENAITFKLTDYAVAGDSTTGVCFNMDYFTLAWKADKDEIVVKKEAENFESNANSKKITGQWNANSLDLTVLSGGDGWSCEQNTAANTPTATYKVSAPYAGNYKLSVVATDIAQTWLSTYKMQIGDNTYTINSTTAASVDNSFKVDNLSFYTHTMNDVVYLDEGENTVAITANFRDGNTYFGFIDYFAFAYDGPVSSTSAEFEAEDGLEYEFGANSIQYVKGTKFKLATDAATGIYYLKLEASAAEAASHTVTQTFEAPIAGNYEFYVKRGFIDGWVSPMKVKINDAEYTSLSLENAEKVDSVMVDGQQLYKFNIQTALKEGQNTVVFCIDEARNANGGKDQYFGNIDSFGYEILSDIQTVDLAFTNDYLKDTETASAVVTAYDEYEGVITDGVTTAYSSSDESVVTIAADGTITAHNAGIAEITASVSYKDKTVTAKKNIIVYNDTYGVIVLDAEKTATGVKVRLGNVKNTTSGDINIFAAVFGQENGQLTSLKNVIHTQTALLPTVVTEKDLTISVAEGDAVKVFVWDTESVYTPCFTATDVQ